MGLTPSRVTVDLLNLHVTSSGRFEQAELNRIREATLWDEIKSDAFGAAFLEFD